MLLYSGILVLCILATVGVAVTKRPINCASFLVGTMIVLEMGPALMHDNLFTSEATENTRKITILIYISYIASFVLGYSRPSERIDKLLKSRNAFSNKPISQKRAITIAVAFQLIAWLLLIRLSGKVGAELFTRSLYEVTRIGFGPVYFTSQALGSLSLVISIFLVSGKVRFPIAFAATILLSATGAKGPMIAGLVMVVMLLSIPYSLSLRSALTSTTAVTAIIALGYYSFWLYTPGAREDLALFYLGYSDAYRNLENLIQTWENWGLGRLWLEDNVLVLIPRSVAEWKPASFGSGTLAEYYFRFQSLETGAPSFTRFGRCWADFGPLGVLGLTLLAYGLGTLARTCEKNLKTGKNLVVITVYFGTIGITFLNPGIFTISIWIANIGLSHVTYRLITMRHPKPLLQKL